MAPLQGIGSRKTEVARWLAAGLLALAVHVTGATLALMQWPETSDDAAGALVVELAPLPAVAPVNSPDLAHGPVMEEVAPAQQATRELAESEQLAVPAEPSPAAEPEVAMPTERPEPKEQPKEEAAQEEKEKQEAVAALATAPPRVEAQPAPSSAPPSPGQSASLARAQASWQRALIDHLDKHKRYPVSARNRRAQGTVVVSFKLDHSGRLVTSHVTRSSGSRPLDEEALAVLERASPMPAPPDHLSATALQLVLPIQFRIR